MPIRRNLSFLLLAALFAKSSAGWSDCAAAPCLNGGTCVASALSFLCICPAGASGLLCADTTNDCASSPCLNGGTCTDTVAGYTCACPVLANGRPAFGGLRCELVGYGINPCLRSPCLNGGTCAPLNLTAYWALNELSGTVALDAAGSANATYVNSPTLGQTPRASIPGRAVYPPGGAADAHIYATHSAAHSLAQGTLSLWVRPSYTNLLGDACVVDKMSDGSTAGDLSIHQTMLLGQAKVTLVRSNRSPIVLYGPTLGTSWVHIAVTWGPSGVKLFIDGILVDSSSNTASISANAVSWRFGAQFSTNILGVTSINSQFPGHIDEIMLLNIAAEPSTEPYTCTCPAGYTGASCQTALQPCVSGPCTNGGTCVGDGSGAFTCVCMPGYTGLTCATNINECASSPCVNGGSCIDGVNGFTCNCVSGFTGGTCATNTNECASDPCTNGGTCVDGVNGFTCGCAVGFSGTTCATNADDCPLVNPCLNGGTCVDGVATFSCSCAAGYTGSLCATNINECASSPCLNGGTCVDGVNGFTCVCSAGFTGTTCATNINECASSPCVNGGTCIDGVNGFICNCVSGFTGATCATNADDCPLVNPCFNGGTCVDGVATFSCSCAVGYTGSLCATNINECASSPCVNGGTCIDGVNSFTCNCVSGFTGTTCATNINECASNPCVNGGTCVDGVNGFTCVCSAGFTSSLCATNINECASSPCVNGGTCIDSVNGFTCSCAAGYTGSTCVTNLNECASNPCVNGGTCVDGVNGFMCVCVSGFTGVTCATNINECASSPCLNGGTCIDGVNGFICNCASGFTGITCLTNITNCSAPNDLCQNGGTCVDGAQSIVCSCAAGFTGPTCATNINECSSNPCANGGACIDGTSSFSCACTAGYSGYKCESNINECASNPCSYGGTCIDGVNSFTCTCAPGFTGATCSTNINECASSPCANGGTCVDGVASFTCLCQLGFAGATCTTNINECASSPCANGGTCIDGVNGYLCTCATGFAGHTCALQVDECLSAPCANGGTCVGAIAAYTCTCAAGFHGPRCATPTSCSSLPSPLVIRNQTGLAALAAMGCGSLMGSLVLENIWDASPLAYVLALASLQSVEGSLIVSNCTNMDLGALLQLSQVGANAALLVNASHAVVIRNNPGLRATRSLQSIFGAVQKGGLVFEGASGTCLTASDVGEPDQWWAEDEYVDLVHISFAERVDCSCPLLQDATSGMCTTLACPTCGRVCAGGTISLTSDLAPYRGGRNCTVIRGSLTLAGLVGVREHELVEAFGAVVEVTGVVVVRANPRLQALWFLASLQRAAAVIVSGNALLQDARLGALHAQASVHIAHNPLLCAGALPNGTAPCGSTLTTQVLRITGQLGSLVNATRHTAVAEVLHDAYLQHAGMDSGNINVSVGVPVPTAPTALPTLLGASQQQNGSLDITVAISTTAAASAALVQALRGSTDAVAAAVQQALIASHAGAGALSVEAVVAFDRIAALGGAQVYDPFLMLEGSVAEDAVVLAWTQNPDLVVPGLVYEVRYRAQMAAEKVARVRAFFERARLSVRETAMLEDRLATAMDRLVDWTATAAGAGSAESRLAICDELEDNAAGATGTRACLPRLATFDMQVVGRCTGGGMAGACGALTGQTGVLASKWIEVHVPALTARLSGLRVGAVDADGVVLHWNASLSAGVTGVLVKVLAGGAGNGGALAALSEAGTEALMSHELLPVSGLGRARVAAEQGQWRLEGCFRSAIDGSAMCVTPYTLYRIVLRAVLAGSQALAAPQVVVVRTSHGVPVAAPRLASVSLVDASCAHVFVRQPVVVTGAVSGFSVRVEDQLRGTEDLHDMALDDTDASEAKQYLLPDATFELSLCDLQPATPYRLRVWARTSLATTTTTTTSNTAASDDQLAAVAMLQTGDALPERVRQLTVAALGDGRFLLSWAAPEAWRGPIVRYDVVRVSDSAVLYSGNSTSAVVVLGPQDHARVQGHTSAGGGVMSEAVGADASTSSQDLSGVLVQAGAGGGAAVVVVAVLAVVVYRLRRKQPQCDKARYGPDEFEVLRSQVSVGDEIGRGCFGSVYRGTLHVAWRDRAPVAVAVKMCHAQSGDEERRAFAAEMEVMKRVSGPGHRNVMRLLGQVTQTQPMLLVMDLCANGDLRSLLLASRATSLRPARFSRERLVQFAVDIAAGMAFLETFQTVHRDLALRNCLVEESLNVRVAGFSRSKRLVYNDYFRLDAGDDFMPTRWMSPEALMDGRFTHASDVWSFGVVLWEIMAWGMMPYPCCGNQEVADLVLKGGRMEQPSHCADSTYEVMQRCWTFKPKHRPDFVEVYTSLRSLRETLLVGDFSTAVMSTSRINLYDGCVDSSSTDADDVVHLYDIPCDDVSTCRKEIGEYMEVSPCAADFERYGDGEDFEYFVVDP